VPSPWLLSALFLLSVAALGMLIRAVLATLRAARLCDVPLLVSQPVEFPTAGRVVLCIEGPRFTPRFRKLSYELQRPDGTTIAGHRILFRTVTSGLAKARLTLRTYYLPDAGHYRLDIRGLEPTDVNSPQHKIVFMRPHLARSIALVVGITFVSMLAIASLVFFLLSVLPIAAAIDPGRVTGYVQVDGEHIELREAFAHLHSNPAGRLPFTPELRLVLADREIPQQSLAGLEALPVLELARTGQVRGLLIRLDPDDPGNLFITLLAPPRTAGDPLVTRRHTGPRSEVIRQLQLSPQRVAAEIVCPPAPDLQCSAHFSAPVFND